jgi:hypothetical protein
MDRPFARKKSPFSTLLDGVSRGKALRARQGDTLRTKATFFGRIYPLPSRSECADFRGYTINRFSACKSLFQKRTT